MIRSARRLVKKGASIVIGRTEEFYPLQRIWKKDVKKVLTEGWGCGIILER